MSMGTRGSARSAAVPKAADKNIIMVAASAWINVLFMIYPLCCMSCQIYLCLIKVSYSDC